MIDKQEHEDAAEPPVFLCSFHTSLCPSSFFCGAGMGYLAILALLTACVAHSLAPPCEAGPLGVSLANLGCEVLLEPYLDLKSTCGLCLCLEVLVSLLLGFR